MSGPKTIRTRKPLLASTAPISWCQDNGERYLSQREFSQTLERLGVKKVKSNKANMFVGIKLIWQDADDSDDLPGANNGNQSAIFDTATNGRFAGFT